MAKTPKKADSGARICPDEKRADEKDIMKMFENAVTNSESYDFEGTIRMLDSIIELAPEFRDAINYKGMMYVGAGENLKAIKCFDDALKIDPSDKEALNNKGIALYGIGKDEEALACIEKAIQIDRRYPDALMNKAVILHAMGREEEARKYVMRAQAIEAANR